MFRVRVWKSRRTYRSSGYGYESLTEITEVPRRFTNVVPVPQPGIFTRAYTYPGYCATGVQNL